MASSSTHSFGAEVITACRKLDLNDVTEGKLYFGDLSGYVSDIRLAL